MSTGKRPISASRAAMGVVRNAPAIFRRAWFWIFCSGLLCDFWPFHQTSDPKSATVVIQLWYSWRSADWLSPFSEFARREIDMNTLIAEVDFLLMWSFQLSFLSSQIPSQRWTSEGIMTVPLGSVTWISSEVSGLRVLV